MAQRPNSFLRGRTLLTLVVVTLAMVTAWGLLQAISAPGPPHQPIAFSHKLHAGEKQMPCEYCHTAARRSTSAGLPSVERCMGCHLYIAARKPEILRLASYWARRQPIPWVRVYELPDFVYFSHKRHVLAGVRCQDCHGPVERMQAVYQYSSLEMGWCLSCHQQPMPPEERDLLQPVSATMQTRAPTDCATCHK